MSLGKESQWFETHQIGLNPWIHNDSKEIIGHFWAILGYQLIVLEKIAVKEKVLYQAFILIFWFKMYPWVTKYLVRGNVYLLVFQLIHEDGISRVSLFCNPNKLMGLSNDLHWFLEVHYIAYEISLPRNQKASRSSNQFTGDARRRGTCWIIPWGCNQQDPYCGITHRGIKNTSWTNQLKKEKR